MGKKKYDLLDKKRQKVWVAGPDGGSQVYFDSLGPRDEKEIRSNRFWLVITLILLGLFTLILLFLRYSA